MNKKGCFFLIILSCIVLHGCATHGMVMHEETIPVNWGAYSSNQTFSQIISLMDQNIRRYNYFVYTHSINESPDAESWEHQIRISTYSNAETITMISNYFAIHLHYTNNRNFRSNGIPVQFGTIRGSANAFNSLLDRIALLLRTRDFSDNDKLAIDLAWLANSRLVTVSRDD